jgi:hypothetical protein
MLAAEFLRAIQNDTLPVLLTQCTNRWKVTQQFSAFVNPNLRIWLEFTSTDFLRKLISSSLGEEDSASLLLAKQGLFHPLADTNSSLRLISDSTSLIRKFYQEYDLYL